MPITWSCVARNDIILAEAGSDDGKGSVTRTAKKITSMTPTCGWEMTRSLQNAPYRGIKFHLHETECDNDKMIVWSFCCVYNSKRISQECAKAYLSKLVFITEALRCLPSFREGPPLSAQRSFAPILLQQMEDAERIYKLSSLNQRVDETRAIMQRNIETVLEKGEKIENLEKEAEELNHMSKVFKKKSRQWKRYQMLQNAKYGFVMGTAITAGVTILAIPLVV
ncbi:hypothetical protein ACHAXA_005714 [Cyclostephanos tholiformis]|uniref:V-SNARE coiled-coil homology domain-containing protein n=1 Tax=Cyclostephanos tholiformis TaxID=382380 RepID=A0ABD3RFJ4_9STRA